jgi:hypothetical protein
MRDLIHERRGLIRVLALGLVVFGLLRIASLVLAEPVVGFANQYDMHRSSACLGLWPDAVLIGMATPAAPQPHYRRSAARPAECYPSSQVAVAWLGMQAGQFSGTTGEDAAARISLHWIGVAGLLCWMLAALLIAWMFWSQPLLLLGHGVCSALLIADPFNTLYLNTLYTEFPAVLAAYGAVAVIVSLWVQVTAPAWRLLALVLCLLILGASRVQHLALPIMLSVFALLALMRHPEWRRRSALVLLACCTLIVLAQVSQQRRFAPIARANIADTVLGAAMPAADPERLTQALGLPAGCAEHAYATWYRQHGVDVFAECPQLAEVSRLRLLVLSLRDPEIIARMLLRGLLMSQHLRLGYLGERAGGDFISIGPRDHPLWFSVAGAVNALPATVFLIASCAALGLIPTFWLFLIWRRPGANAPMGADSLVITVCAHLFALTLLSSVFGDGYSEVGRHLHLGLNALLVLWVLLPLWLWRRRARWRTPWLGAQIASALVLTACSLMAVVASLRLPLAFGVLGMPAQALPSTGMIELRGWALDRFAIQRLYAQIDDGAELPLARSPHPRLDKVFPYLDEAALGGFHGSLDAAQLRGGDYLQIFAVDAGGRPVLIERRRIR